jgi:hypothetical protein
VKYRQIETKFWEDGYVLELTNKEREFFLYLITNPKVNMCGIYELSDKTIVYTLGCSLEELTSFKKKLQSDNKYAFFNGWVYVFNFHKYNSFSPAPNIMKAFIKDFNSIPSIIINHFLNDLSLPYILPGNYDKVMVKDNDKDKGVGDRLGGRVGMKLKLIKEVDIAEDFEKFKKEGGEKE